MRRTRHSFVLAVLAFCLTPGLVPVALSQSTGSYSWKFTPIDVPGATRTYAGTMSSTGQIVGDYDSSRVTRGINPTGDMVGTYTVVDPDGTTGAHGFAFNSDGTFTTIDGPADPPTRP